MIDLDDLEQKAKAADAWVGDDSWSGQLNAHDVLSPVRIGDGEAQDFIEKCDPAAVLELIAEARRLRELVSRDGTGRQG